MSSQRLAPGLVEGFKLCLRDSVGYRSVSYVEESPMYYRIGEWARPRGLNGPLAVFDQFNHMTWLVRSFGLASWKYVGFKVEYLPSSIRALWVPGRFVKEWETPSGTRFAERVKLVEVVREF